MQTCDSRACSVAKVARLGTHTSKYTYLPCKYIILSYKGELFLKYYLAGLLQKLKAYYIAMTADNI